MTHRDILEDLDFQDWNFTEYWKQFLGFSEKRIKKNMKYLRNRNYSSYRETSVAHVV